MGGFLPPKVLTPASVFCTGCFTSRRREPAIGSLIVAGLILLVCSVSMTASAAASRTWTTQADFQSGNLFHLDATSSLGQLLLENAVSPWVKSSANPVLGPGAGWESDWVDSPSVLFESGVYKMWYQGCVGTLCGIGYATSSDGIGWTRFPGNPVLAPDAAGWDQTLGGPVVVHDGTLYRMWYAGNGPLAIQIGYATSPDGTTWTRYGNAPVFMGLRSWDSAATSTPVVIKVGFQWVLYFSGHSGDFVYQMGRATSPDGVNWTEDPLNPLMAPDVPWESSRVHPGGVVAVQVGNTSSPDSSWSAPSTPVLVQGPTALHLPRARFAMVAAVLATSNASVTPVLDQITLTYSPPGPAPVSPWTVSIAGIPLIVLLILIIPAAVALAILALVLRSARAAPAPVAAMRYCTNCGSMNQPTNRFCFQCGRPLTAPISPPSPPT